MQVQELLTLAEWYKTEVIDKGIPQLLTTLCAKIKNNYTTKSVTDEALSTFETDFIPRIEGLDLSVLTPSHRKCLKHSEVDTLLLEEASDRFKNLHSIGQRDIAYFLSFIEKDSATMQKATNAFQQLLNQIPIATPSEYHEPIEIPDGQVMTRLTFHNQASIDNVVDFEKWSKSWLTIARGFSMAINESPEEFQIVNADRGSFIVDLLVGASAMAILARALKDYTDLAVSITDLYLKLKQVEGLKNAVPKETYDDFVEQAKQNIEEQEQKIVDTVVERLKADGLVQNTNAMNELTKAIKELNTFNNKGGSIHCIGSGSEDFNDNDIKELNSSYKQLQDKSDLKLLEEKD